MKNNWDIFLNIAGIIAVCFWDWFTGESAVVYPNEVSK